MDWTSWTSCRSEELPGLLGCALLLLADGCPPEARQQLCQLEDVDDGTTCRRCWETYLFYVANGRRGDPYREDRLHDGGLIGA